ARADAGRRPEVAARPGADEPLRREQRLPRVSGEHPTPDGFAELPDRAGAADLDPTQTVGHHATRPDPGTGQPEPLGHPPGASPAGGLRRPGSLVASPASLINWKAALGLAVVLVALGVYALQSRPGNST